MQLNNKVLAIIFFALLGIWIVRKTSCKPSPRSFRSHITMIDTSSIDKILLWPNGINDSQIELTKDNGWIVSNGSMAVKADLSRVNSILGQLVNIPVKQLVSKNPERQKDYEVDLENGKVVEIYSDGKLIDKIIVGRFNFNQQTRAGISYARKDGEDDIYSVDGFMSMSFDTDFNGFRPKQLLQLTSANLRSITVNVSGLNMSIQKDINNNWVYNGIPLDSSGMSQYTNGLGNVIGSTFYNGIQPLGPGEKSISFQGDNMIGAITMDAWTNNGAGDPIILRSSLNEALFTSDSTGVYDRVFGKMEELLSSIQK